MANTARITALMLDGTKHEATGIHMPTADKVAFEEKFGISWIVPVQITSKAVDEKDTIRPDADVSGLREKHPAFFAWRVLVRGECPVGTFEEFIAEVEDIVIERVVGPMDPTAPNPATT